jgi:RHS repeat-associated protein
MKRSQLLALLCLGLTFPLRADVCTSPLFYTFGGSDGTTPAINCSIGKRCYQPVAATNPSVVKAVPSCDPTAGVCVVDVVVPNVQFPGNRLNYPDAIGPSYARVELLSSGGGLIGSCGAPPPNQITDDLGTVSTSFGVQCGTPSVDTKLALISCQGFTLPPFACEKTTLVDLNIGPSIGCPIPPPDDCGDPTKCVDCKQLANGGGPPPPTDCSVTPGAKGLSCTTRVAARFGYRAGGVGGSNFPGTGGPLDWRTRLGQNWSHTYAKRIVMDPDANRVWLLTEHGSFRKFELPAATSPLRRYTQVAPSDEFRVLSFDTTTSGWQLKELNGVVHVFRADGQWDRTVMPQDAANPIQGIYTSNVLTRVDFPDGRKEFYTYHASGRLASLEEVPAGGTQGSGRTWTFSWSGVAHSGFDLSFLGRPDGTTIEYTYGDVANPGFITRIREIGTDGTTGRVVSAFEYNANGFVTKAWANDTAFTGPNAVGKQEFSYVGLPLPTQVTMTEWIAANDGTGQPRLSTTTWDIARDTVSSKPKITKVTGECSVCGGIAPETTWEYSHTAPNPSHPLLPSAMVEKRTVGTRRTEYTYSPALLIGPFAGTTPGTLAQRREAVGDPLARTTSMTYDPNFPQLVTRIERPSTDTGFRATDFTYDSVKGTRLTQTITGREAGAPFTHQTTTTYTAAGEPEFIDPPNAGTGDRTQFTYGLPGNGHLPVSRIDPHVGATTFAYDGYSRRTSVTDPNGVATVTDYDALNRVTKVTRVGNPSPAGDLVTEYFYDCPAGAPTGFCAPFRDLRCVKLPEGNAVRYRFDALGRMIATERAAGCAPADTALERTAYTLDLVGHRVSEELQRPDGVGGWITESRTDRVYKSRCHLDTMTQGAGSGTPSVTDYCYDPNNNLIQAWDALHPKVSNPTLPSTAYEYDILDRLTAVRQPWVPGGANEKASTEYKYDVQDHLREVKDAEGNVTTYVTSDRDLMTQQASPVSGTTNYAYNAHGALTSTLDARGITIIRQVDELDRVTKEIYPDPKLVTDYVYDTNVTPGTDFFKGRLKSITRNGEAIAYTYDRFGRMLQDGTLTNTYDKNGRKTQITYPNGVVATYGGFDVADRPTTMTVSGGGLPSTTNVVTAATYKPSGPLATLGLGNGLTETRLFDSRYFPDRITVSGKIDWDYLVDAVGNVTQIADGSTPRLYGYRDYQYFLTSGSGPWPGPLSWTYDKIGNRLTEVRGAVTDTYSYVLNGLGGRNPKLTSIATSGGGPTRNFAYDSIGDEARVFGPLTEEERIFDDAGRLTRWVERTKNEGTTFRYDGRGFLRESKQDLAACTPLATTATYSSAGLLIHRRQANGISAATAAEDYVLYFAGRPVAQLSSSPGPSKVTWLTTDHLGTPVLSTVSNQSVGFVGGFEPFGREFVVGLQSAQSAGVFLRFPGQWDDGSWSGPSSGRYYNVNRWYQGGLGRYERPDPAWRRNRLWDMNPFGYAGANPINAFDTNGLETVCCNPWDKRNLDAIIYQVTEIHAHLSGTQVGPPVPPLPINPWANTGCDQGSPPYAPSTWYNDWSPGNCINACVRAHEQYHRDGCSRGDFAATLDEGPAYLLQIACLEQIRDRDLLILDIDPLGPGNCNKESCP